MYICLYMNHIKHNTRQRNYEDIVCIIYKKYIYIYILLIIYIL